MSDQIISKSTDQTQELVEELVKKYLGRSSTTCLIFALQGDWGSGKTVFVKGLAKALGISTIVRSPSYTLVAEYKFKKGQALGKLIHVDLWRVDDEDEFRQLGAVDQMRPGNIIAIEWAEKIKEYLQQLHRAKRAVVVQVKFFHHRKDQRRIEWA